MYSGKISSGRDLPNDFNVIIEIPANSPPFKFRHDKDSGAIFVDRLLASNMSYPMNYGYVPQTLSGDGGPVDVLVDTPFPLLLGAVIRCRPIGLLLLEDDSGVDAKVLAVPVRAVTTLYDNVITYHDMSKLVLNQVVHFFEHYKDLDQGRWVRVIGWSGLEAAEAEIVTGARNYIA